MSRTIYCKRNPRVIAVNLVWDNEDTTTILSLMNLIPNVFPLADLFDIGGAAKNHYYAFRGCVVFWGQHYYNYMRVVRDGKQAWVQLNDTTLYREDGWPFIINNCLRFQIRPTLLIFERIDTDVMDR